MKQFASAQGEDKKLIGLKKSMSKANIKDPSGFGLNKRTTNIRPSSAKNSSKQRSSSGKREIATKTNNKSRSRDKSKQMKSKEASQNRKVEDDALLTSLKNLHKSSSFAPFLEILDSKKGNKVRPPKAPKPTKVNSKDNILMNIENLNINQLRSRQINSINKSNTIQHSPSKNTNLEIIKSAVSRKTSFINSKKENNPINFMDLK